MIAIRKNAWLKLLMTPLLIFLSGCVYLIVGGVGAVGGYIVSPDTVEGISEFDAISLWDSSNEIISIMGTISEAHEEGGIIIAKTSGARVTIHIISASDSTTKLSVKARKAFLPKIDVAQDVFVKIMNHVAGE